VGSVLEIEKQDGAPMLMVGVDAAEVERQLKARELACPKCEVVGLRPWGFVPGRRVRQPDGSIVRGVRRSRCRDCGTTHVLLPVSALRRRLDAAETIVPAVIAHARGMGHRRVAAMVNRSEWTVRDWLRRARQRARVIHDDVIRLGHERFGCDLRLAPLSSPLEDAFNVVGVVAKAAARQLGPVPFWEFVAGATKGALLCNTSPPFPPAPADLHAAAHAVEATISTAATADTEGEPAHERPPP
jgi:hypothetical protein